MSKDHGDYVRRVQGETQRYSQNVLGENERLRTRVAVLESERASLDERARVADELAERNEALSAERVSLLAELQRLRDHAASLAEALARHEESKLDLEARLRTAQDEGRRFSAEYLNVERQNSNLANLYVASYRLHGTLDRDEVLQAIQEILSNLVGSEEMALFELDPGEDTLRLAASFGIDAETVSAVALDQGLIGRVACSGQAYSVGRDSAQGATPEEATLTACIPLKLDGKVTGVLAVFRLLPQKQRLEPLDDELFDLLSSQAAIALYCTGLHARFVAAAVTDK
jgi:hypothetical protein